VGLVDKKIQEEIKKDKAHYKLNTVKTDNPNILSYTDLFQSKDAATLQSYYILEKEFQN
jgi:hypothetical protein